MLHIRVCLCTILGVLLLSIGNIASAENTFRIVQISDSHIRVEGWTHNEELQAVVAEINELSTRPDIVLSTGDYTDVGAADQYGRYVGIISKLTVPVYHALGNHEVKWSSWGKAGSEKFLHQKPHYSFDHKGVHFISLDSTMWINHDSFLDPLELRWLKSDLRKTGEKTPVVLFYHHCPNYIMNEAALFDVLKPYNVKLALVGHEHAWGTYVRNGIHLELDEATCDSPGMYRIIDFSDTKIRTYRKEVGKEPVFDEEIKLAPISNPIRLIAPRRNEHLNGSFEAVAESAVPMQKVDIAIDGKYQSASISSDGKYHLTLGADIIPGHHIVIVRGTDSTGAEWQQSAAITVGDTKREVWRFNANAAIQGNVTVKDDRAFFGCYGGNVYCLDASSGHQVWKTKVGSDVVTSVAVEKGVVYFGVTDGSITALSAQTGKQIWKTNLGSPALASPVVEKGIVYAGGGDDSFYALDAVTGVVLWKTPTGGMIQVTPLISDNKIFFGNWNCNFYCLDAKTGKVLWTREIGPWKGLSPASGNPAAYGSTVLFTAYSYPQTAPDLFCVDMKNGKSIWEYKTVGGEDGCGQCSPYVAGDSVFVNTANGQLVKISASDGKEIWRSKTGQMSATSSPIEVDGKVFSCGMGGMLSSFDAKNGSKLWSYFVGNEYICGSPSYWNGNILVPSMGGSLVCIKDDETKY